MEAPVLSDTQNSHRSPQSCVIATFLYDNLSTKREQRALVKRGLCFLSGYPQPLQVDRRTQRHNPRE